MKPDSSFYPTKIETSKGESPLNKGSFLLTF
nr:MAG TPA: hypothetical protein [Caudoviricetes sp.]DAU40042.1 MAG TPA: hypothetical protein [Caudoviricetes sp.]